MTGYLIIFDDTGKGVSAWPPDLLGCTVVGTTLNEVDYEIRKAIESHIEGLCIAGKPIPEPRDWNMLDWNPCRAVYESTVKGDPLFCFRDSGYVQLRELFDHFRNSRPLSEFLECRPRVTLEQVKDVLEFMRRAASIPATETKFRQTGTGSLSLGTRDLSQKRTRL